MVSRMLVGINPCRLEYRHELLMCVALATMDHVGSSFEVLDGWILLVGTTGFVSDGAA